MLAVGVSGSLFAQTLVTGPSTTVAPYVLPLTSGYTITSIKTAPELIGSYTMSGIPDGLGAYDNNDGTFTLLMNHEIAIPGGVVRAHGSNGAFVSKWVINKNTLAVSSVSDLIQNVKLWTGTTYTTYNATTPSTLAAFSRFCSADLPATTAFYNKATGKGTQERIFMNGEESGNEGRIFAHIATGANAGTTYELPLMGKYSTENACANPRRSDKAIVISMDDSSPLGQVYIYVGNKTTFGTEIDKAGLTNGNLYSIAVSGMANETSTFVPNANTTFSMINISNTLNLLTATGATLNTVSNNLGVTNFLRPEDGCWDPSKPNDFYFNTTNAFNAPSRVWKLHFNDIDNPQLGGTITAVLDGTEGQMMLDNMTIDNSGHIYLQEDVGNNAWLGRMLEYDIASDVITPIAQHDANLFLTGASAFLTQDEESSGIIDVQSILGAGKFMFVSQAHYGIAGAAYEGGQLMLLSSVKSATSNPEVNVQGNAVNIVMGNTVNATSDNSDMGSVNVGGNITKTFVIQNTGTGALIISGMDFTGTNAGDFTFVNAPTFPASIAAGASLTITAKFSPVLLGVKNASLNIYNNDLNESLYDFAVKATAVSPEIDINGNGVLIIAGATQANSTNNTDFGSVIIGNTITKTFVIQNTGNGTLTINSIAISGANASDFSFVNAPTTPFNLNGVASQSIDVKFTAPSIAGTSVAKITINCNDADESLYDFAIQAKSLKDVGLKNANVQNLTVSLSPNPTNNEAVLNIAGAAGKQVAVFVYDLNGKMISRENKQMDESAQSFSINTSSLVNGVYFVKVVNANSSQTLKMIVSH